MKKKKQGPMVNAKVAAMAAMMASDSDDSYGSEEDLKQKAAPAKTRGGRKRTKKQAQTEAGDSERDSGEESTDLGELQGGTGGASVKADLDVPRGRRPAEQPKRKLKVEKAVDDDTDKESVKLPKGWKKDIEEEKMSERQSEADQTPKINIKGNVEFGLPRQSGKKEPGSTQGGRGRAEYSPPMIKEYDPNEENAKTRAEKRRAELKKKRQQSLDKEQHRQVADDPRPWKGRPSEFFELHQPKRGTHKVLNNEQKDFLLIYYPESVVPPVSLMDFLYKSAKEHEDKEKRAKAEQDGVVLRGKKNRKKKNQPEKRDVYKLVHVNEERRDTRHGQPVDFEALLEDEAFQPDFANKELTHLRQQIDRIQQTAIDQMRDAEAFSSQHLQAQDLPQSVKLRNVERRQERSQASTSTISHGFCPHCHMHSEAPTGTAQDETEIQRQQILRQICAAKQRQARMEAEEARRLKDEARRLAESAKMLEIEAQRPLLEAQRLEKEILEMQGLYSRLPQRASAAPMSKMGPSSGLGAGYSDPYIGLGRDTAQSQPPTGLAQLYQTEQQRQTSVYNQLSRPEPGFERFLDDQRFDFLGRREQLINEARNTQLQIQALKQQAATLQQQSLVPKTRDANNLDPVLRGLYNALENPRPRVVISTNSLAARKAAEERRKEQEKKEAREAAKREKELQYYENLVRQRQREAEKRQQEAEKAARSNQPQLGRVNPDARSHSRKRPKDPEPKADESEEEEEDEKEKSRELARPRSPSAGRRSESEKESEEEPWKPEPAPEAESLAKKKKPKSRLRAGSGTPERLEDDPALAAANKEFEKAQKAFEKAQLRQKAALLKKEMEVKQQQAEVSKAQDEAKQYFEQEKKKNEDQKRVAKAKKINAKKVEEQKHEEEWDLPDYESLLLRFNQQIDRLHKNQQGVKDRYEARDTTHEFLGPILSGKILRDFDDAQGYINFGNYYLDDNFLGGHAEYFRKWRYLFLYEAYSFLMNSRWSKFSGSEMDIKNSILQKQAEKAMCWKGYFQFHKTEGRLCSLRLLKEPPVSQFKHKNYSKIYDEPDRLEGANFELSHCREDDLIVISKFRVNLEGGEDIKMVSGGSKFIKELLSRPGVIFGYVKKAAGKLDNFVEVLVDGKYQGTFQPQQAEQLADTTYTRYCYHFESLLTALREFKAIKQLEFTRLCPILCYPTLTLQHKDRMLEEYSNAITNCFAKYENAPALHPKVSAEDDERARLRMDNYLIQNHHKYNTSQSEVLEKIVEMPKDNVMLIQGPPGTGKTHTIIGILSMIMCSRRAHSKQKIMVCAPSNAAIDQIIIRIVERGLIGLQGLKKRDDDKKEKKRKKSVKELDAESSDEEFYEPPDLSTALVRVSSAEYQTDTEIKKHTLEQRIIKKLCIEKFGSLKRCIKDLKEMIKQLNDFDAWEDYQEFPFVNRMLFKNYTKCLKEAYIKTVDGWGDVNLSRAQQTKMMEHQLKMHEKELQDFKTGQNVYQGNQEWKEAEKLIISDASIVCCTLAMAGSAKLDTFENSFEYLIVDEACQSTEMQTLIPFRLAPKRVILVGDQQQLPATTFSSNSESTGYCRSLFERLLDSGFDKTMLTIQFRMHPKIRAFPSEQFYGGQICDHASIGFRSAPVTISNLVRLFTNRVIFFDLQGSEEVYDNKSKCNFEEADFTRVLVDFVARKMSLQGTLKYIKGQIGVISPYKAQVRQLHQRLDQLCVDQGCAIQDTIEVNTVDAFQGSEKDIIIFNCVRSNAEHMLEKSLGFLLDERRLNVAITRPKYFLMIVGNAATLTKSTVWGNLLSYCQAQGQMIPVVDRSYFATMADFKKFVVPAFMES